VKAVPLSKLESGDPVLDDALSAGDLDAAIEATPAKRRPGRPSKAEIAALAAQQAGAAE